MLNTTKLFFYTAIMIAVAFSLITDSASELLAANPPSPKKALEKKKGHDEKKHSEEEHHGEVHHAEGHHNHSHHFAIFSGVTSNIDAEHTDFTLGAEYAYRLPVWGNRVGVGVIGERVFADFSETILAAAAILHAGNGFKFMLAPGVVFAEHHGVAGGLGETTGHGEEAGHGATAAETETVKEFLFRTGVAKDFHAGKFSITPTLCADFIEGHVSVVYGLTFGKGF